MEVRFALALADIEERPGEVLAELRGPRCLACARGLERVQLGLMHGIHLGHASDKFVWLGELGVDQSLRQLPLLSLGDSHYSLLLHRSHGLLEQELHVISLESACLSEAVTH